MAQPIHELLKITVEKGASDLHISTHIPPRVRIHGFIMSLDHPPLSAVETKNLIYSIMTEKQKKQFEEKLELDFSFGIRDVGRFRANVFNQKGAVAGVFRSIPADVMKFSDLGIPLKVIELCNLPRGLVLVTGPTGSGKSTTLASMIDHINREKKVHIITIEDPIEFFYTPKQAVINQRELFVDTLSFPNALRSVLREDPDVVLVGEMRDLETIESTLRVAETGHLTFSTLHTNSAVETISRIIDVFPPEQQSQVRTQLSMNLKGVLTQTLLPRADGKGRVLAIEILLPNSAIRNLIRENKIHQIYSNMQIGQEASGMQTFNQSLASLYFKRLITYKTALGVTHQPKELISILQKKGGIGTEYSNFGSSSIQNEER